MGIVLFIKMNNMYYDLCSSCYSLPVNETNPELIMFVYTVCVFLYHRLC